MICWFSILPSDVLKSRVQIGEEEKNCLISLYYECFPLVCIVTQPQGLASPQRARITFLLFFHGVILGFLRPAVLHLFLCLCLD